MHRDLDHDGRPSPLDDTVHPILETLQAPEEDDEPIRPINWHTLTADEAETEWLDLNAWVESLRHTYGLPPTVIPPFWHRHDELVWELSALHLHWLNSYHQDGSASGPHTWHRDFADARHRLREWVATCGTRLDRDRPTRQTAWPGEPPHQPVPEATIANRDEDFIAFVNDDVNRRLPDTADPRDEDRPYREE